MLTAEQIIKKLGLVPLRGEGGMFRQVYLAEETIAPNALPARYQRSKKFYTAIFYLLTNEADSFSALHKLPTDELYHFYLGDPVQMLLLYPDGRGEDIILGPSLLSDQKVQFLVPRDVWQGSRLIPGGSYALMGTTMAPGYDDEDYKPGQREELIERYPQYSVQIRELTR